MVNSKYRENYSKDKTQGNDYSKPSDYSSSELCKKEKKCCIPIFENDFNTGVGISILNNYTPESDSINEIGGILNFRLLSKVGVICDDYSILLTIPKQYKYSSLLCKNESTETNCCYDITDNTQVIDTHFNFVPNGDGDYNLVNELDGTESPFAGSLKVSSYNNTNLLGFLNKDSSTGVSESRQKWGQYFRASSRTKYITGVGLESGSCGSGISGTIGYGLVANGAYDIVSCGSIQSDNGNNDDFSSTKVYLIDLENKLGCGKTTVNLFGAYLRNDVGDLDWYYPGFYGENGLDYVGATSGYDVSLLIDHDVNCNTEGFLNINYCYTPKLYYYDKNNNYKKTSVNYITLRGLNVGIKNKGCNSILETACLKFQEVYVEEPTPDILIEGQVILKPNKLGGFSVPQISILGGYINKKFHSFAEIKFDYSTNIDIVNKCVTSSKSEY